MANPATLPRLRFALIINGPDAPTPAPRVDAVPAECAGLFHVERRDSFRPDYEQFRAALPSNLRRYVTRKADPFPSLWYDKRALYDDGRTRDGGLPFYTVRKANGDYVATVYASLVEEPA